jgi:hypothetical protein
MLKKVRSFFNKEADKTLMEVEIWEYEGEGINHDEDRAWALIKELYNDILYKDDQWHFFYENFYNIIRCSKKFYPKVIKRLKKLDIVYKEKGEWVDEQRATRKYQDIFQPMFHSFTMMALKQYHHSMVGLLYDRVSHCFLNHQYYVLDEYREFHGRQWESRLVNEAAMGRAQYSDRLYKNWIDTSKSNLESKDEIVKRIEEREKENDSC